MRTARRGSPHGQRSLNSARTRWVPWAVPLIFFGVLFYWPVCRIIAIGLRGQWLRETLTSNIGAVVAFTVAQAAASAALSLLIALPSAYVLYRKEFAGQHFLRAFITVPFMLPTIVVAISFSAFHSISPLVGILIAHVFMNFAIAVRVIGSVWHDLDPHFEAAAELDGAGRIRAFWSITLPNLRTAIASAGALIFLYCTSSFGIVLVLGGGQIKTIETEIYVSATQYLDLPKTSGLALIQCLITLSAFLVAHRLTRGSLSLESSLRTTAHHRLDSRDVVASLISMATIAVLIVVPLATVLQRAFLYEQHFSTQNFKNLGTYGARDILSLTVLDAARNSVRNILVTISIAMTIGLMVSYLLSRRDVTRRPPLFRAVVDTVFQLPVGISSVVLGFGYLVTFSSGLIPLRSSWFVIPLAQALVATPLVIRIMYPALIAIDSSLIETAEIDRATPSQMWWQIELPAVRQSLRTAVGFAALVSLGEFGTASFLAYGDQGTLPTVLFQLISRPGAQNYGMAMATSAVLIAIAFLVVFITNTPSIEK